ncbi:MAG: helix-turn-helix transcriptional regulator [Kiritimatiellae bacterium]|nr:helix-turn-helix transcriptional regulator [Kiritimatiellia bacterium]
MAPQAATNAATAGVNPELRTSCDCQDGSRPVLSRRDDSFSAVGSSLRMEIGPVYSGEWAGEWRSRMPLARMFYVLAPGDARGVLSDAGGSLPLLGNTWAFLPPGREIHHRQGSGIEVVSVHFRITLRGRTDMFLNTPLRGGAAPEFREVFANVAQHRAEAGDGGLGCLPCGFSLRGALWTLIGRVAADEWPELSRGMERDAEFARLFEAVEAEPERAFSVAEMARIVNEGESAFAKHFRSSMGMSPHAWLGEIRARATAEALLDNGVTVADVAERFGFGNEFYFSRFFKRHFGSSPSVWRRQMKI